MAERRYQLAHAVKVRDEDFGLLFYLCKTTGLVFINSGPLLKADALVQGGTAAELLAASGEEQARQGAAMQDLLAKLVKRGLVNAQG